MNMRQDELRQTERRKVRRFRRLGWGVYNRAPGLGYQTTCQRCSSGMLDLDEVDDDGICSCCRGRELARENVRRLEAWAITETRRRLAEAFALESVTWSKRDRAQFAQSVFIWETSGERKELRKIVDRLMDDHHIRGLRFVVKDPAAARQSQEAGR